MIAPVLATLLLTGAAWTSDSVPLYDNLGSYHREVTTTSPTAQQYFDQGLRLVYAFNHAEAIRAFNEAARLDPNCAMCYWGTALAYGPHVNAPMDSASGVQAYAAVQEALRHLPHASARERAFIRALATRYAKVPPANRARLDSAYANAMREVVRRYPNDLDAATLYAEAKMDLRPWNYWTKTGEPFPGTREILRQLERVIQKNPNHPGACHFYIHAVEAVAPEKALPCAERLAGLMPGAGHLVHMPAHIYIRVGRYNDAINANVHAVHTDETYIASERPQGLYPAGYYPHNYHFLAFAATMAGRSAQAIDAARNAAGKTPVDIARAVQVLQYLIAQPHVTLVTFGRWEEVLRTPVPAADLRLARGLGYYAHGVAHAALGHPAEAQVALDSVRAIAGAMPTGDDKTVLEIAMHALLGEMDARRNQLEGAISHFRMATRLEDGLTYVEPPQWYYPVRHSLGAVLLKAGRFAEAEAVYREDLKRFPENGWSLRGLAESLRARGQTAEAEQVDGRFRAAWSSSDTNIMASRF